MRENDNKTRILNTCYELMLSRGYTATSVGDICLEAGVSKGSFYHFFDSKQECALEMLKHHMAQADEIMAERLDVQGLSGAEAAIRYVELYEQMSEEVFKDGCLIGAFALELAESHPEMRQKVSSIFDSEADAFERIFTPFCEAIDVPNAPTARELANQMITVIEGGVVLSKAHGDISYVSRGIRCFRKYLQTLRAGEAAETK